MKYYFSKNRINQEVLEILLIDRTRTTEQEEKNILWATDDYKNILAEEEIQFEQLDLIQPRYKKIREQQKSRTRTKAEVFTPTSVCELQNTTIDKNFGKIFWQDYISKKILEITCGEAPYLVSRYDSVTGEEIEIKNRVGTLDKKLKVICKTTSNETEWLDWSLKAVQSIYGYEFQGDSLFLARLNIISTVQEFFEDKFKYSPPIGFLKEIAEIISWNLWQMDGENSSVPLAKVEVDLFSETQEKVFCRIKDW